MDTVIAGIVILVVVVALAPFAWRLGKRSSRAWGDSALSSCPIHDDDFSS